MSDRGWWWVSGLRGGVWSGGGCPVWEVGVWSNTPRDGYCRGRYASYWNAFLLKSDIVEFFSNTCIMY